MKTLIISTLIICSSKINSQINVDSLFDYIQSSNLFYSPKQHKSLYLLNTFSNYTKKDSSEEYYVYLDSNKKLSSFLDLCILYEKFDSKKRLLKKVGYSRKGFLSFYDFPPYIENIYKTDTSIELIYDKDYALRSKKIKIFNKNSQVVGFPIFSTIVKLL